MELLKFLEVQLQKKSVGTLTLSKKNSFREIFFQGEQAYLVGEHFSGKVALQNLSVMGIPGPRLSREAFDGFLRDRDRTKRLFPQLLHEAGIINDEEFTRVAEEHLTEEIADLLLQTRTSFHYQDGRVPEYLLKAEDITCRTPVPLAKVLAALTNRKELWVQFESMVASKEEIFVLTASGMAARQSEGADPVLARVLEAIDGMRNLGSIITDTYIYRAHVARALMYGLEEGFIKKTVLPELKGLSTNAVTRVDAEAYLPLLKNAVKYAADELGARERLAVVFERLQRIDEAVIQYNYIGDALYLGRKMAKALKAYQKAIQLKPDEILVTEKITKIYMQAAVQERDRGNTAQALQLLMSALWLRPTDKDILVKALPMLAAERKVKEIQDLCDRICLHARQTRSPDGAVQALTTIVNAFPKSAAFRKKLVNVLLDFGKNAEASAELQVLAKQCLEHGQADKAQELMEKARRVGSARLLARDLERRVTQRTSKTRSRIRRIVVMGLIAASTCEIWSYWDWNHVSEASATVEAASHPEVPLNSLIPSPKERDYRRVAAECDGFLKIHPVSIWRFEAEKLRARLSGRINELAGARTEKKLLLMQDAKEAAAEGKRTEVDTILEPLLGLPVGDEFHDGAVKLLNEVKKLNRSAQELLAEANKLEADGEHTKAHAVYRALLDAYPSSILVYGLKLPIVIDSMPSGADIHEVTPAGTKQFLGSAPHAVMLPVGGATTVELSLPGYAPLVTEVRESDGAGVVRTLRRRPDWSFRLDARVEGRPTLAGGWLLLSTSAGNFQAIGAASGKVAWTLKRGELQALASPPIWGVDGVATLWNTGKVLFLAPFPSAPDEGSPPPLAPSSVVEFFLGSLATSPLHAPKGGSIVVVGTKSGQLQAYRRSPPALAWSLPIDDLPEVISDMDQDLLVGTRGGTVLRVKTSPPSLVWKKQVSPAAILGVFSAGKPVMVVTKRNDVLFLKPENGEIAHTVSLVPGAKVALSQEERRVYALDPQGNLSILSVNGQESLRARRIEQTVSSIEPLKNCLVLVDGDRKGFSVLAPDTLETLWSTVTPQPISAITGDGNWIGLATTQGQVMVFRKS